MARYGASWLVMARFCVVMSLFYMGWGLMCSGDGSLASDGTPLPRGHVVVDPE